MKGRACPSPVWRHNSLTNCSFSSVPAAGEEVHSAQETELGRGVRVGQRLLRQRVQLGLLGLRGLQLRVSQPRQSEHSQRRWNILFPVGALTGTTRTRNIWEPWRWDLKVRIIFQLTPLPLSVGRSPSQGPASQVWGVGGSGGRGRGIHQPGGWERSAPGDSLQTKEQVRPSSSLHTNKWPPLQVWESLSGARGPPSFTKSEKVSSEEIQGE